MLQDGIAPGAEAPFRILAGVKTTAGIPYEISSLNIPGNMAHGYPKLQHIAGWKQDKGNAPIALIGGGPSLKDTFHELKDFPVTMCASSHDWLIEHGHIPTFCTIADPDRICANYVKRAHPDVEYLVATQCHPDVFEALKGQRVRTWHLYAGDYEELNKVIGDIDPGWEAVGGGCTVGLRNMSIAMMMGYHSIHFFGYDSCYGESGRSHVYDFSEKGEEEFLGQTYKISVNWGEDGPTEKIFYCAGYQMAQAQHFKDLMIEYSTILDPTVHGGGLIAEYVNMFKQRRNEVWAELRRLYVEDRPKLMSLLDERYKEIHGEMLAEIEKQLEVNNVVCG